MPAQSPDDDVSVDLLDSITHQLAGASGPAERASVIYRLVLEIYETVQWLHQPDVADEELLSVSPLLTEALRHQRRMAATPPTSDSDIAAAQDDRP